MTNARCLGGLTVDMVAGVDGITDTFYVGHGPTFRKFATITQDGDGWYRVHPEKGYDGVFKEYREAIVYLMCLGENA